MQESFKGDSKVKIKGPAPEKILAVLFYCIAILQILTGIPLALRLVPPNFVFGFRISSTLKNEAAWYEANQIFGATLTISQAIILITILLFLNSRQNFKASIYKFGIALNVSAFVIAVLLTFILVKNV